MKLKLIFLFLIFSLISKAQVANAPCNNYSPWVSSTYSMSVTNDTNLFGDKWGNKSNLIDGNLTNAASWTAVLLGSSWIEAQNPTSTQFPIGSYAGFVVGDLDLVSLGASMKVTTYNGTTAQESKTFFDLVGTILDGGKRKIGFVTTKPFNRIRLTVNAGLTLIFTANAYYAEVVKPCAGANLACNTNTPLTRPNFGAIVETSRTGLSGVAIGLVANQDNVTNTSTNDFATLSVNAGLLGSAQLSVKDLGDTFTAGTFAGFDIQNINLLSLSVFSNITIKTYLDGVPAETKSGSALFLSLPVLDIQNRSVVGFTATKSFDEIQIIVNQPSGVSIGATNVFSAVVKKPCEGAAFACNASNYMTEANYPVSINPSRTGLSGVASAASAVTNPNYILDNNTGNFASITLPASAIASGSISVVKSLSPIAAGTFAGFDIENANLVSVSALSSVTVKTYLGGILKEERSGPVLGISAPLFDFQNRTVVGFETTQAFDEVQLVISQPLGLTLGTTNVFGLILKKPCEGADLVCNTPTFMTEQNYPVNISSARTGITGIASAISRVNEPDNVLDTNNNNYATISVPLTAGTIASLSVLKSLSDLPAGTYAGFDIQNVSLINAQFLQNITLKTYNNGVLQESVSGNGILFGAGTDLLASDGRAVVGFVTTKAFDEVQISLNNVLGFDIGNTRVYKMVTTKPCAKTINCNSSYYLAQPDFPTVLNTKRTGLKTLGCLACSVNNPDNVIDNNPNNFSRITLAAGVLNSGSISVLDPTATYPKGTYAGFTVKDRYFFVQGDLLEFITVRTYLDGILQESKTSTDLIDLTLLIPIWGTGTRNVGFYTTKPFDEVQIETVSITSLVNVLDIYGAFIDTRSSNGTGLSCTATLVANPDAQTISAGSTGTVSILANDTYNGGAATTNNVTTTQISTTNAGVNVNPTTGLVTVAAGTPAGEYKIKYRITDKVTPDNWKEATATITVPMPAIDAVAETFPAIVGNTGGTTTSVLANDTLGGQSATTASVNLTGVTVPTGLTLNADGTVTVAAGTPAGNYNIEYRICDKVNTSNCDTVTSVVVVSAPAIDAVTETFPAISSNTGGTTTSVLANDTLGGQPATTATVNLTGVTVPTGLTLNADGTVTVAAGIPAGNYNIEYKICDKLNPSNCDTTTSKVVVFAPAIDAVTETFPAIVGNTGGTTTSVLANDTLGGQSATTASVNLTGVTVPTGLTLNADGTVTVAAGTPAGNYNIEYRICDKVNTSNCDTVTSVVVVSAPAIDAVTETFPAISSNTGGTTTSVLANDTLGGQPATTTTVNLTGNAPTGLTLNADGTVTVAPNTTVGNYNVTYTICDKLNPSNCDTVTSTVVVSGIIDLKASIGSGATTITTGNPVLITYSISNIGSAATNGNLITVTLMKPTQSTGTMTALLIPSGWTKVNETAQLIQFTTNNVILPNTIIDFAYNYTQVSGTQGFSTIRTIITNGSGGDTVNSNNIASQSLTIIP